MSGYIQPIIAMMAVINPLICGAMLLQEEGQDRKKNIVDGLKAMGVVLLILVGAAIGGRYILNAFGISLDAFKIVGGFILGFIGSQMMVGSGGSTFSSEGTGLHRLIIFAASPASIAMVVTLSVGQKIKHIPIHALVGTVTAVAITVIVIIVMQLFFGKKKIERPNIGSRFMGMIIAAMGIQFTLEGIKNFFL